MPVVGADGLNIVVPFSDPHYYSLRPTIAVKLDDPRIRNRDEIVIDRQRGASIQERLRA